MLAFEYLQIEKDVKIAEAKIRAHASGSSMMLRRGLYNLMSYDHQIRLIES